MFFVEDSREQNDNALLPGEFFQPIWLYDKGDNTYIIIDGFKRYSGWSQRFPTRAVPSLISRHDTNIQSVWKHRIQVRQFEENVSFYSLLRSIDRLSESSGLKTSEILSDFNMSGFGIHPDQLTDSFIHQVLARHDYLVKFADPNKLSFKETRQITRWSESSLLAISQLLRGLNLKGNKLLSILKLIDEVHRGQDVSPDHLLENRNIQKCLKIRSPNQRYNGIKRTIYDIRNPTLVQLRSEWLEAKRHSRIDPIAEIKVDDVFESDELEFSVRARSPEELREKIDGIRKKLDAESLDKLFSFI